MEDKVIIIAEAGVNHNGNFENAKKLIEAAANAGADYVKFQTFKADKLVSKDAELANYQKVSVENDDTQYKMLKKLEMPFCQNDFPFWFTRLSVGLVVIGFWIA